MSTLFVYIDPRVRNQGRSDLTDAQRLHARHFECAPQTFEEYARMCARQKADLPVRVHIVLPPGEPVLARRPTLTRLHSV